MLIGGNQPFQSAGIISTQKTDAPAAPVKKAELKAALADISLEGLDANQSALVEDIYEDMLFVFNNLDQSIDAFDNESVNHNQDAIEQAEYLLRNIAQLDDFKGFDILATDVEEQLFSQSDLDALSEKAIQLVEDNLLHLLNLPVTSGDSNEFIKSYYLHLENPESNSLA